MRYIDRALDYAITFSLALLLLVLLGGCANYMYDADARQLSIKTFLRDASIGKLSVSKSGKDVTLDLEGYDANHAAVSALAAIAREAATKP